MSNAANPKQHGAFEMKQRRPKSSLYKRANKEKARARRVELKAKGLNC